MPNAQGQGAYQVQTQQQTLTPQQVLTVRLTELPLNDLRERIDKELEDNPWLQGDATEGTGDTDYTENSLDSSDPLNSSVSSDSSDSLAPFDQSAYDDDLDDGIPREPRDSNEEQRSRELGDTSESFFDYLVGQLGEYNLTDHELEVMKYLIGSLADDGLLRTPLHQIADELDIYQNIQTSEEELERLLTTVLQQMDPAGVGGRDLRECLTLQARRNYHGPVRDQLITLFQRYWDDFAHLRWQRIQHVLKLDDLELERLRQRIQRLNPRPGGSLGGDRSD
ncbi:MAG: RNA polymerase sigma-54 factor, partial [Bacteroidaceae bacterium]|nr:RNA polymerase sigma-54 factor [Bacteroidaceae bacterium]